MAAFNPAGDTIVGSSGQTLIVAVGPDSVDGAVGTLNSAGQLKTLTSTRAQLSLSIDTQRQTFTASLTPADAADSISFSGLPDHVAPVSRVVNLAVRTSTGAEAQTLIVGFVVRGEGSKNLLLRGLGPALVPLGVVSAAADPQLRLFGASGGLLAANDDWGGSPALVARFNLLGAFLPPTASQDAALTTAVPGGLYSFHIVASTTASGVALAEVYDGDAAEGGAELMNLSTRAQVGTGENILIVGFVITGNTPRTLLLRGLGPSLIAAGVTGTLGNPQLALFRGSTRLAQNDDWAGTAAMKNAFAAVGAAALASDTSKDAALLVTLPPGVYTAQVSGVDTTTGVALVEIFLVP